MMRDLDPEIYNQMRFDSVYHGIFFDNVELFIFEDGTVTIMDRYEYVDMTKKEAIEIAKVILKYYKDGYA